MPTPAEFEEPQERRVVEPIRVLRPRNTDALAELFREMTELTKDPVSYESIPLPADPAGSGEPATEELPPMGSWTDPTTPPPSGGDRAATPEDDGPPTEPVTGQDWHGYAADPSGGRDWAEDTDRYGTPGGTGRGRPPVPPRTARDGASGHDSFGSSSGRRGGAGAEPYGAGAARPGGHPYGSPPGRPGAGAVPGGARQRRRGSHGAATAEGGAWARGGDGSGAGLRRAAITVGVCAAALVGFAGALLVPGRGGEAAAETVQPTPTATQPESSSPSADPDGAGTLREGDSGPEVTDLQQRLLKIPDVYGDGATDGRYDTALTEAVARFQLWYGIRGDEDGVYGDDTREALESRTNG
ncbi:peptidoglycan-binding protein [Streptomyces sp. NPDC096132]|uniref:peptidoglycan-binding protein n=1 Tax=Streptomyces sp. NPDC096132 TaxID=3366075 RepID=UPI00381333FE